MININAIGLACPLPVINAKKALKSMEANGMLTILVDNKIAAENLEKLSIQMNCRYTVNIQEQNRYEVIIVKGEGNSGEGSSGEGSSGEASPTLGSLELEQTKITPQLYSPKSEDVKPSGSTVIAITSDSMGKGSEELGKTLMKSFLYALTEQENLPSKIIFYNSGVKLAVRNSSALEDLKMLEGMGVEILACGACLNYYQLTEQLAVGAVTNMYSILESLMNAERILYP